MEPLSRKPARPRRRRSLPTYPRAIGAGLLLVAAACGEAGNNSSPYEPPLGGAVGPSFCPSEPPAPNDYCSGWYICRYESYDECPDGSQVLVETEFRCQSGKVQPPKQSQALCPPAPSGAGGWTPFDDECPEEKPTEGELCSLYNKSCAYEKLVRCPDGQPETIDVHYVCHAGTWELHAESKPLCE